jgi:hypothetical protein
VTRRLVRLLIALSPSFLLLAPAVATAPVPTPPSLVVEWNRVLLDCVRQARLGPTTGSRAMAEVNTCGYDAWAMYDDVAMGTRLGGDLRRPPSERTEANRKIAYSYAAYRALLDLFPGQVDLIRSAMTRFGFDPEDATTDPATPQGVGNVCARAVTDFRHHDGSNQLGDLHAGPYTDYTGYAPVNDVDHIVDPNRWQPLRFSDGKGGRVVPGFLTPHWGSVVPFALTSSSQLRPEPPQRWPAGGYVAQAEEILRLNAHLDEQQKVIVEYWADGPGSDLPPGHWIRFAEFVSLRDHHGFDEDVKLFFLVGNAVFDAGIATWEAKRFYDAERPITAIRFLKAGKRVLAYIPFQGPRVIRGEDWRPYQPETFVTPPFPEYTSGHSAFSAAAAEILKRFTGSDFFGASYTAPAGSSKVEPGFAPSRDLTLSWPTFTNAADEAGLSRRLGGIHFEEGDVRARALGRQVGALVWDKGQSLLHGTPALVSTQASRIDLAAEATSAAPTNRPALARISPNPSAGEVRFEISLPRESQVRLTVLDVRGREIASLVNGSYPAGLHAVAWDGRSGSARTAAGVYYARLHALDTDVIEPLVRLR